MLRIVLVEPREAGNVGAVARAMKNFGFDDLWIVGDHPPLHPLAGWWASGADDLVEAAHFANTLHDAVADAQLVVATTSARGRTSPVDFTPRTLSETYRGLVADQRMALVFGREDSGLTREELMLCHRTASIPTNPALPTMNLAQSVCVFCYELASTTPAAAGRQLPDAATLERIHERAQALLVEVGFLHDNNPDRIYDDLRAIVARASLDEREATILLGLIRQIEWALSRESYSGSR
jgi:TrmH family RNA methyltransferase